MSSDDLEGELFLYSKDYNWSSVNSIKNQRNVKLPKSESYYSIFSKISSDNTLKELELVTTNLLDNSKKTKCWDHVESRSRFPRMIRTRSLLRDEMEMLKINMSIPEKLGCLKEFELNKNPTVKKKKRKIKKIFGRFGEVKYLKFCSDQKVQDLMNEIEGSESAKTDTVVWKFLKRESSIRKIIQDKKNIFEWQDWLPLDFYIQNTRPLKITCPNCTFFITTKTKKVSTIKTRIFSIFFSIIGFCIASFDIYSFKDVVHLCPLCRIYLGFCPAIDIRTARKGLFRPDSSAKSVSSIKNTMVSASSTSAKNLFVESKLRLSDRVQVNVNNIAAIARQIQRGSKANENLIAAAKNFALQEAAIENSETNLKKLRLLTTHLNTQIDSIQSNSAKMETVLEQVRSMQY